MKYVRNTTKQFFANVNGETLPIKRTCLDIHDPADNTPLNPRISDKLTLARTYMPELRGDVAIIMCFRHSLPLNFCVKPDRGMSTTVEQVIYRPSGWPIAIPELQEILGTFSRNRNIKFAPEPSPIREEAEFSIIEIGGKST